MPSGGSQKTETKTEPWSGQQPYLADVYSKAQGLYNQGKPGVYYGTRVAPFRGDQLAAQQGVRDFASPTGGGGQAMSYMSDVIGGKYLDQGNPHFSAMADRIAQSVIPNAQSAFETSGRFGGGYNSEAIGKTLSDQIGNLAYQDYGAERGYQQQAATAAPGVAQQILGMLGQSGQVQQNQTQREVQAAWDKFNDQQNLPWTQLGQYANAIGTGGSYPTQTTTAPGPGTAEQIIAALTGGVSLAGGLGWTPFG